MKEFFQKLMRPSGANRRDLPVFLAALLTAFCIWLLHNLSLKYNDFLTVPVIANCNIEGHSTVSANTSDVVARCRLSGYEILSAKIHRKKPVEVSFAKMHHRGGEMYYVTSGELLEYVHMLFGDNATLDYFVTDTLNFRFPVQHCKKVPVEPVLSVTFAPQYIMAGDIVLEPDSVTVYGEPIHLEEIHSVQTEPVKYKGLTSAVHSEIPLKHTKGMRLSDESVKYRINTVRYVDIPATVTIKSVNVPKDRELVIYPPEAKVVYRCIFPITDNDWEKVGFFVDYSDFASSVNGRCIPHAEGLPKSVLDYSLEPAVFDCFVEER